MSEIENGGPAFPHEYKFGDGTAERADGITVRDYFAAKAIAAAVAKFINNTAFDRNASPIDWDHIAGSCYDCADAMLAARSKK